MILDDVLAEHGLTEFTDTDRTELVGTWHLLTPWPDSRDGPSQLRETYITASLSNGSTAFLIHLARAGRLPFGTILSAELIHSCKPDPKGVPGGRRTTQSITAAAADDRLPRRGSACRRRRRTAHRIHSAPAGMGPRPSGPRRRTGSTSPPPTSRPGPATRSIAADPTPPGQFSESWAGEVRLQVPTDLLIGVAEDPCARDQRPGIVDQHGHTTAW